METVEIEVGCGRAAEKIQVLYSPRELMAQPFNISHQAVLVMEMRWMQQHLSESVRESVAGLYVTSRGPFETLAKHVSNFGELRIEIVALVDGKAYWEMALVCDECEGAGETQTVKGTEVTCPTCDGCGDTSSFEFVTDVFGRFVGYDGDGVRNKQTYCRPTLPAFDPLPLEEALAITEREWS